MSDKKSATVKSKIITDQVKISANVEASIHALRERTQERLAARLGELPEHGQMPDFGACQDTLASWLAHLRENLSRADAALLKERRQDGRLRAERDRLTKELVGELRKAQWMIESLLGPGWSAELLGIGSGLQGIDAYRLEKAAEQAVAELRSVEQTFEVEAFASAAGKGLIGVSAESMAAAIEAAHLKLRRTLALLPASLRRTQEALGEKQERSAILAREIQRVSQVMEGLYRLADLDFHADRLRPTQPGSAGVEDDEGEGEETDAKAQNPPVTAGDGSAAKGKAPEAGNGSAPAANDKSSAAVA